MSSGDKPPVRSADKPGELLGAAGYSEGDIIPLTTYSPSSSRTQSTTNTDYGLAINFGIYRLQWDQFVPDGATAVVKLEGNASPGADETFDIRVQNPDDGETIIEQLGVTAGGFSLGWDPYTPTTTEDVISPRIQIRTNPGSNSSTIEDAYFHLGVKL